MNKRTDPDISIQVSKDPMGLGTHIFARLDVQSMEHSFGKEIMCRAIDMIAEHIACEFIEKHGIEIASKLDPVAIANLTIADAAAKTRQLLDQKLPERVERYVDTRTKIYQRGIFGGLRKL